MKLVVLCPNEKQDECRLVTSLDHFRVGWQTLNIFSKDEIRDILSLKLVNSFDRSKTAVNYLVQLITSKMAGNGKSLWINSKYEEIKKLLGDANFFTHRFHNNELKKTDLVQFFNESSENSNKNTPIIFHLDVTNLSQTKLDDALFSLFIQRMIMDDNGGVWKRDSKDFYIVECLECGLDKFKCLQFLPKIDCLSPVETLKMYNDGNTGE